MCVVWENTSVSIYLFIYYLFILAALGLRCCTWLSLVAASRGYSSLWCPGFSLRWRLLLWSMGSRRMVSVVVVHRFSCSAACGIFLDQGSNPRPLHWQILNHCTTREAQFSSVWALSYEVFILFSFSPVIPIMCFHL